MERFLEINSGKTGEETKMKEIRTNFHTHVQRCRHAGGTEEDYVKEALAKGLSQLGFSDHAPFPESDYGMRMPFGELGDYLDTINTLTKKYQSQIILWKGLEIEYLPEHCDYYEELLTKWGVDYLLMGEHYYKTQQGGTENIYSAPAPESCLEYAHTLAEGMRSGYFKAVAHPDVYMINPFAWDDISRKAADIIIDAAVATDTVLEYNANGFRREQKQYPDGVRYQYPHAGFWEMAAQAPVRAIVGSDCHDPSSLWDCAVEASYRRLRELGLEPVVSLL